MKESTQRIRRLSHSIVSLRLSRAEVRLAQLMAVQAEIGGGSWARNLKERMKKLTIDQLVGQYGECALSLGLTNSVNPYIRQRMLRNTYLTQGDSGCDLPGMAIGSKASLKRSGRMPQDYHLLVRPAERYTPNHMHLLLVAQPDQVHNDSDTHEQLFRAQQEVTMLFVGWAYTSELPKTQGRCPHTNCSFCEQEGEPALWPHILHGSDLHRPMIPYRVNEAMQQ